MQATFPVSVYQICLPYSDQAMHLFYHASEMELEPTWRKIIQNLVVEF